MTSQRISPSHPAARSLPATLILAAALLAVAPAIFSASESRTLWQAAHALSVENFTEAERLAASILERDPECHYAAVIAGDATSGLHEHERAIEYYHRVPDDAGELAVLARRGLGERWLMLGNLQESERNFRYVLQRWPDDQLANRRCAYLMQVQGRPWESVEPTMRMIRQGLFGAEEIHTAGCPENRFVRDNRLLQLCRESYPDDPGPLLAAAKSYFLRNQYAEAEDLLDQALERDPSIVAPYIPLGRIYLDSGRESEFVRLNGRLPAGAGSHAGVWVNRGLWAARHGDHEGAARCLYEALSIAPNHVEANYMLSQALVQLGDESLAEEFGRRAKILARIELRIPEFYEEPTTERIQQLIADFVSLDRYWEAAALYDFAIRLNWEPGSEWNPPEWALDGMHELSRRLMTSGAALYPRSQLASVARLSSYPFPDWSQQRAIGDVVSSRTDGAEAIRFEDRAREAGLEFEYFNGSLHTRGMEHIFETTGGGTAAIDYDQDQWPDLYLTQGAAIWDGDDPITRLDALFRNNAGQFTDVTTAANLGDEFFSQGVTVGDFNNDGFADLYVCNLRGNRFYENNGDGTFSEITESTGTAGDEWSLSCVLADLNDDGNVDLYVVNYLERDSVYDRRCKRNGHPLTCAPTMFPAEQDRVYLSLGDGRFEEVTESCGIVQAEGKGLAILAADLDQSGRISLFVGNDTAPNFLFLNRTPAGGSLRFQEAGIISGLALDGSGRSQATMGIAYGDISGRGLGDIFITNFYRDSNTLYSQQTPGQFVDTTRVSGMREPSLEMLGFGTEFVDADVDGNLDLFVANGHVDRTFATREPDEMPPQFFYNVGRGQFRLPEAATVGRYFEGKYLGRSVARGDWNRDGLDDLCVLHLYSPVALLCNETGRTGNSIRLSLRGTACDRDAIGTTVTAQTGEQLWTHQLVAGDGYMTSNERQLTIGLGEVGLVEQLRLNWPDGTSQVFEDVEAGHEYIAVQGQAPLRSLP